MRASLASFTATALVVACTRSAPPTVAEPARVAEVPVVDAAPPLDAGATVARTSVDAGANDAAPPEEHVLAWTDPKPLEELTKSCAAQVPGIVRPKGVDKDYWEASPLSCAYGLYGQSCVVDPCFNEQKDVCHDACEKTCDGCAKGCTTACVSVQEGLHQRGLGLREHVRSELRDVPPRVPLRQGSLRLGDVRQTLRAVQEGHASEVDRLGLPEGLPRLLRVRRQVPRGLRPELGVWKGVHREEPRPVHADVPDRLPLQWFALRRATWRSRVRRVG
jgi:hypothetical protein